MADFRIPDTFTDSLARLIGEEQTAVKASIHLGDELMKVFRSE